MNSGRCYRIPSENIATLLTSGMTLLLLGFLLSMQLAAPSFSQYEALALILAAGLAIFLAANRLQGSLETTQALTKRLKAFGLSANEEALTPILDSGPVGTSWNQLISLLHNRTIDESIERRVDQALGHGRAEKFARALRSVSEGLAITDRHGKINYANPAWLSLVGGEVDTEAGIMGHSLETILASRNFHNWDDVCHSILEGTKPINLELRHGRNLADGVLQLSRVPLEGRAHETEGYVWTLRDITQNALARDAHEQFLAAATHELRTPLTNIKAYSESLIEVEDISPAQQKEFFNVIHAEADRLSRLLNQLLDIQQLEAGSMTIKAGAFDVQRMVQEVQEHISPLVAEKQLKLICRIAPDLKSIQADKEKIISCLINLLGNAVKYTPEGGEVRLIAEQQDSAISISVEDTGIGIAKEELPKIFDRFYRCQDERVADIEGNGLGLAFAMEVARLHEGELKVESQLDKGSRFTLRLPLAQSA